MPLRARKVGGKAARRMHEVLESLPDTRLHGEVVLELVHSGHGGQGILSSHLGARFWSSIDESMCNRAG